MESDSLIQKERDIFTDIKPELRSLIQSFKNRNENVNLKTTEIFGKIAGTTSEETLVRILKDKDIQEIGEEAFREIGKPVVDILIHALKNESKSIRWKAAASLEKIGKSAVEYLIQTLKNSDRNIRLIATWALEKIGKSVIEPLIKAMKNEKGIISWKALEIFGKIRDEKAVDSIIPFLKDKDWGVRESAVWALGKIGGFKVVDSIIQALRDEEERVRYRAIWAIKKIRNTIAFEAVKLFLKDKNGDKKIQELVEKEIFFT